MGTPVNKNRAGVTDDQLVSVWESVIAFIEERMTVPVGSEFAGRPMRVLPWQARFFERLFGTDDDFALSVARGAGKSALISALSACIVHPEGPLHSAGAEVVVLSASHSQGALLVRDLEHFLLSAGVGEKELSVWNNQTHARAVHKATESGMLCLGSSPARLHSRRPRLVIIDELGAFADRAAAEALATAETACGKVPGSRVVLIGTRPPSSTHPFSDALERWPSIVHSSKSVSMAGARRANPSLEHFPELEKRVRRELRKARKDAGAMQAFKALRLNLGGALHERDGVLINAAEWEDFAHDPSAAPDDFGYVLGVDMGSSWSSTGVTAYWPNSGCLRGFAAWPELPSLQIRGQRHAIAPALLARGIDDGSLVLRGKHTIDVEAVLGEALERWGVPRWVVYDRWRASDVREGLFKANVPYHPHMHVTRGMGFKDSGPDISRFRKQVREGKVRSKSEAMLLLALNDAKTIMDEAGGEKFVKRRRAAVDDLAVSAVLSVATGSRLIDLRSGPAVPEEQLAMSV